MTVDELFGSFYLWHEVITREGWHQLLATCRLCGAAVIDESDNLETHRRYHETRGETL